MSLMEDLTKLYGVDRQVRGLRSRLDSAHAYFKAQGARYDELNARLEELRTRRKQLQAKIANLEVEGTALDEQLAKFRNDLNSAVNSKQYQAVLDEVTNVKDARSKLDDTILDEMGAVEEMEGQIAGVEEQLAERTKVRDVAEAQLREREADVGERLAELEAERASAAAVIPGAALAIFEEMSHIHDGDALAPVDEIDRRHREYACGECNLHLPFEQVASLMVPTAGLVRCPSCGRILYIQDEVRRALAPK